jgi:hypothetical protein
MSTAPDYTPGTSFADDEANNVAGRSLVKTTSLDTELANVSTSINDINANLQALQRDDNKLRDGIIEPYALSEQTNALIAVGGTTPRGTWQPETDYKYKDLIQRNNIAQICLQPHNSGSVFVQSFWLPISGDGTSAANAAAAAASASAASTSAANAATSATTATNAASAASTSATNAATSATNASNSAASASTSATDSSNSASESATSAAAAAASAASINAPENNASDPTYVSVSSTKAASPEWVKGLTKFTKDYVSPEQTITAAGALTLAHQLGAKPKFIQVSLICKTANIGYAVDDEILINPLAAFSTLSTGVSVVGDATNLNIRFGSYSQVFTILNKSTGTAADITPASWKIVIKAWG